MIYQIGYNLRKYNLPLEGLIRSVDSNFNPKYAYIHIECNTLPRSV